MLMIIEASDGHDGYLCEWGYDISSSHGTSHDCG